MRKILLLSVVGVAATGCMQNKDPMANQKAPNAMALAAAHDDSKLDEVKEPPLSPDTLFASGALAETQGHMDDAIAQYTAALKIDPDNEKVLFHLGLVYATSKNYPKAIETWQHYVAVTHQAAAGYSNLGFCYELAGNMPEAEGAYRMGIGRDPNNEPCRTNLGLMLAKLGRIDEALDQLQVVLTPAEAHYDVGSVLAEQGKVDLAKVEFDKSLILNPKMWEAKRRLEALNAAGAKS